MPIPEWFEFLVGGWATVEDRDGDTTSPVTERGTERGTGRGSQVPAEVGCSFSIRRVRGTIVVSVQGAVDLGEWSRIDRLLTDIIDAQGNLDVLLELADVVSLERAAMPLIVDAARQARDHGGRLRLADRACREHRQPNW